MKTSKLSLYVLTGMLCMLGAHVYAQDDQVKLFIKYDFEHTADSTKKEDPIKKSMYLYIGDEGSYYTASPIDKNAEFGTVTFGMDESDLSDALINLYTPFQSPANPFIIAFIGQPYKVSPKQKSNIAWDISTEEREIGGYQCYKAIGEFAGRTYEAWFTEEIPYAVGPWKLSGLPGTILEANDLSNEVRFFYAGLDVVKNKMTLIKTDRLTELAYDKYRKALENSKADKLGSMLASLPADAELKFTTADGREMSREEAEVLMKQAEKDSPKYQLNNPVERSIK